MGTESVHVVDNISYQGWFCIFTNAPLINVVPDLKGSLDIIFVGSCALIQWPVADI